MPAPGDVPAHDTLRAWAERDRPMLARGRTEVAQAGARVTLARRELWPDLAVGVQYGQRAAPADEMAPLSDRIGELSGLSEVSEKNAYKSVPDGSDA